MHFWWCMKCESVSSYSTEIGRVWLWALPYDFQVLTDAWNPSAKMSSGEWKSAKRWRTWSAIRRYVENNIKHHKKRVPTFGGVKKSPPYGRAQRLTRPKRGILTTITHELKKFFDPFQSEERNEKWSHHRIFTSHEGEELVTTPLPPESMLKT